MPYIFTCEHGGNRIPRQYLNLFKGKMRLLQGHRGWDPGALQLARACASYCSAPLYYSEVSRLVIDLNRTLDHRGLFSVFTRPLDTRERRRICERYYLPYRQQVETVIGGQKQRPVIHLSFHSFTPELDGMVRSADIGLLYDPARRREKEFCLRLQTLLRQACPGLAVRRNYPYRGTADGFTTYLRSRFPAGRYLGIEIEINQRHVGVKNDLWCGILKEFGVLLSSIRIPI